MTRKSHWLGLWTLACLYLLLWVFAYRSGELSNTMIDLVRVWTGNPYRAPPENESFLNTINSIACVAVFDVACCFVTIAAVTKYLGPPKQVPSVIAGRGPHVMIFFLTVFAEELYARWFFLGLLTKLSFLSGPTAFYLLFLLGNVSWALLHLTNFKVKEDRHPLRVLSQFIGGFFQAYIFMKHGLLACVISHMSFNMVLLAGMKKRSPNAIDALIVLCEAAIALFLSIALSKPLSDLLAWLDGNPTTALAGWNFWDYLKVSIFFNSAVGAVIGLMVFDRDSLDASDSRPDTRNPFKLIGLMILGTPLLILNLIGLYGLLGWMITDPHLRILTTAIVLACLSTQTSGSATSRKFWTSLPGGFLTICSFHALGFWGTLAYAGCLLITQLPVAFLTFLSDAFSEPEEKA